MAPPTLFTLFLLGAPTARPSLHTQSQQRETRKRKPGQAHPHALKLILQGKKKEAIAYLNKYKDNKVNPEQTQMLIDLALDKPDAWKFDAETWPWVRTLPNTSLKQNASSNKFTIAFGGGAGYVPPHERIWDIIGAIHGHYFFLATMSTSTILKRRRCSSSITTADRASPSGQHWPK